MHALKSLIERSSLYTLSSLLTAGLTFGLTALYGHLLTPDTFGLVGLTLSLEFFLRGVLGLGISAVLPRLYYETNDKQKRKQILSSILLGWLIASLIAVFIIGIILSLILDLTPLKVVGHPLLLVVLSTGFVGAFVDWMMQFLIAAKQPWVYTVSAVGRQFLTISFLWIILSWHPTLASQVVTIFFVTSLMAALLLFSNINRFRARPSFQQATSTLVLGAPVVFYIIGGSLLRLGDRWIIAQFADISAVGLYTMAYLLGEGILLVQLTFSRVWSPSFMAAEVGGRNFADQYKFAGTVLVGACSLFCLALSLFGDEVLMVMGQDSYLAAVDLMRVILVGLFWYSTYHLTSSVLILRKKTGLLSGLTLLAGGVNLGLNFMFVPSLGAMGAAIATLLGYGLLSFFIFLASKRLYQGELDYVRVLRITLIGSGLSLLPIYATINLLMRILLLTIWSLIVIIELRLASKQWPTLNNNLISFFSNLSSKLNLS